MKYLLRIFLTLLMGITEFPFVEGQESKLPEYVVSECYGDIFNFDCGASNKIRVNRDFFGYSGGDSCSYNSDDCTMSNPKSNSLIHRFCTGRRSCTYYLVERRACRGTFSNYQQVEYQCVPESKTTDICSTVRYETTSSYISSPNFPDNYPPNLSCSCIVRTGSRGMRVRMDIIYLAVKYSNPCRDWLKIGRRRTCGTTVDLFSGRSIPIEFHSDQGSGHSGFWLHFQASKPGGKIIVQCGNVTSFLGQQPIRTGLRRGRGRPLRTRFRGQNQPRLNRLSRPSLGGQRNLTRSRGRGRDPNLINRGRTQGRGGSRGGGVLGVRTTVPVTTQITTTTSSPVTDNSRTEADQTRTTRIPITSDFQNERNRPMFTERRGLNLPSIPHIPEIEDINRDQNIDNLNNKDHLSSANNGASEINGDNVNNNFDSINKNEQLHPSTQDESKSTVSTDLTDSDFEDYSSNPPLNGRDNVHISRSSESGIERTNIRNIPGPQQGGGTSRQASDWARNINKDDTSDTVTHVSDINKNFNLEDRPEIIHTRHNEPTEVEPGVGDNPSGMIQKIPQSVDGTDIDQVPIEKDKLLPPDPRGSQRSSHNVMPSDASNPDLSKHWETSLQDKIHSQEDSGIIYPTSQSIQTGFVNPSHNTEVDNNPLDFDQYPEVIDTIDYDYNDYIEQLYPTPNIFTVSVSPSPTKGFTESHSLLTLGLIILCICIGVAIFVSIIVFCIIYCRRKRRKPQNENQEQGKSTNRSAPTVTNSGSSSSDADSGRGLLISKVTDPGSKSYAKGAGHQSYVDVDSLYAKPVKARKPLQVDVEKEYDDVAVQPSTSTATNRQTKTPTNPRPPPVVTGDNAKGKTRLRKPDQNANTGRPTAKRRKVNKRPSEDSSNIVEIAETIASPSSESELQSTPSNSPALVAAPQRKSSESEPDMYSSSEQDLDSECLRSLASMSGLAEVTFMPENTRYSSNESTSEDTDWDTKSAISI